MLIEKMDVKKRATIAKRSPDASVTKRGWLEKQGSDGLRLWKARWFVLSEYCLYYYNDSKEDKLLGSIALPSYTVCPLSSEDRYLQRRHSFRLQHANMRTYYFSCPSRDTMAEWVNAIALASIMQPQHDLQLTISNRMNECVSSVPHLSTAVPQQLTSPLQSSLSEPGQVNGTGQCLSAQQPLYANAPPKPRRLGGSEPCSPAEPGTSTSPSAAGTCTSSTVTRSSPTGTAEVNIHTPLRHTSRVVQERRTPEVYSPAPSQEQHLLHKRISVNYDFVSVQGVLKKAEPDCSAASPTTVSCSQYHSPSHTVLDVKAKHSCARDSTVLVSMNYLPTGGESSVAIIDGTTNKPGMIFEDSTENTNNADGNWTEQEYANRMRQASYLGLVDRAVSSVTRKRQKNWQFQSSGGTGTDAGQDSRQHCFSRSASARYGLRRTRDQHNSRAQTPTLHHERQREESMQRLLEWKQRMLMSPLTRKSAKISCSRGVTPVGHFTSGGVSNDQERCINNWPRPNSLHGLTKPDSTGDIEVESEQNKDYVNLLHMHSADVDAHVSVNDGKVFVSSGQLPNRNRSLTAGQHSMSWSRLADSHCDSDSSTAGAMGNVIMDKNHSVQEISTATCDMQYRVSRHNGVMGKADHQFDSIPSVLLEGSSSSKQSNIGYNKLRADFGTDEDFSVDSRKVFQGVTDRDITNLVDTFEHGFAVLESTENGVHEREHIVNGNLSEGLQSSSAPNGKPFEYRLGDHDEMIENHLKNISISPESDIMQEPLKPVKSPTEILKARVSAVSNGFRESELNHNWNEKQLARVKSSVHKDSLDSTSDPSDVSSCLEVAKLCENKNGHHIKVKSGVESACRLQPSMSDKFGAHIGPGNVHFHPFIQGSESLNKTPEPLYVNSVRESSKHVSPENHYLPMTVSNQIMTVRENELCKDSNIKLHMSRAASEPLPPLPNSAASTYFEDGTYMEMCPALDISFDGTRNSTTKQSKNGKIAKSHDYSIIPDNSFVFKKSIDEKLGILTGSHASLHNAACEISRCGKKTVLPPSDLCHNSSDADDEGSKEPENPRLRRFSLSDTFRPASYYLQTQDKKHDSSESDLVFPPFVPSSLQENNRAQGFSSVIAEVNLSNKHNSNNFESSDRPSQTSDGRDYSISTATKDFASKFPVGSCKIPGSSHSFILKSEDQYPESDASSFSHKELRSEEKYPLSESASYNHSLINGDMSNSLLSGSKIYENIRPSQDRKSSDLYMSVPSCGVTDKPVPERQLSSSSLASIELLPVHTPEFLSDFARSVQEGATPDVKNDGASIVDCSMERCLIDINRTDQLAREIEIRKRGNQPINCRSLTDPADGLSDKIVASDIAEPIACHHSRGNSNISVGSVNSTGSENRAPYYYSDLIGSSNSQSRFPLSRPQLNNERELEFYKPSNIGRKVNRISKRKISHNDQISGKLRSSYEYIACQKRSDKYERNIIESEAHCRVHQRISSPHYATHFSECNVTPTQMIIENNASVHRRIRSLDGVIDGSDNDYSAQLLPSTTSPSSDKVFSCSRSQTPDLLNSANRSGQSCRRLTGSWAPDSSQSQSEIHLYRPEDRPPMPLPRCEAFCDRLKAPPYRPPPPVATSVISTCHVDQNFPSNSHTGYPKVTVNHCPKTLVAHSSESIMTKCHKMIPSRSMDHLISVERNMSMNNSPRVKGLESAPNVPGAQYAGSFTTQRNLDSVITPYCDANSNNFDRYGGKYLNNGLIVRSISNRKSERFPSSYDIHREELRQRDPFTSAHLTIPNPVENVSHSFVVNRPPSAPQLRDSSASPRVGGDNRIDRRPDFASSETIHSPGLPNNTAHTSVLPNKETDTAAATSGSIADTSNLASMFIHCVLSKG